MNRQEIEQYLYLVQEIEQSKCLLEVEVMLNEISLDDVKKYVSNMKVVEDILKKYNVSVIELKRFGKILSNKVTSLYKKGVPVEEASNVITKDMTNYAMKKIKTLLYRYEEMSLTEKILLSLSFFIIVGMINGLAADLVYSITGDAEASHYITAIVVAPMTEEGIKNYFIEKGMPWVGTGVVFGLEFLAYVLMMIKGGISIGKALIARLIGLLIHFTTTFIQSKIIDTAEVDNEDDREQKRLIAYVTGVCIHAAWNTFAVVYNKEINQLLKGKS